MAFAFVTRSFRAVEPHGVRRVASGLAAVAFLAATPLAAQDAGNERPELLADLEACRAIAEADARLACFDRTSGAIIAANDSGEVRMVDRQAVEETRRGLFGFTLPKIGIFSGSGDDDEMDLLESTISGVSRVGRSGYRITIPEGSVWQINSAPSRLRPPRVGDTVVFKKASLSSFFIRIAGQMGVKGSRVE